MPQTLDSLRSNLVINQTAEGIEVQNGVFKINFYQDGSITVCFPDGQEIAVKGSIVPEYLSGTTWRQYGTFKGYNVAITSPEYCAVTGTFESSGGGLCGITFHFRPDEPVKISITLRSEKRQRYRLVWRTGKVNREQFSQEEGMVKFGGEEDRLFAIDWKDVIASLGNIVTIDTQKWSTERDLAFIFGLGTRSAGETVVIDPSLVGTSTTLAPISHPYQRKVFWANGRWWVFYSDGTNMVYCTSTDGVNWSSASTIRSCSIGHRFSIFYDGTYFHYVCTNASSSLFYRRGYPNSDGTITWSASEQTAVSGICNQPTITVDNSGYVWIGYRLTVGSSHYPYVTRSGNNDGTWGTPPSGFPYQLSSSSTHLWRVGVVPLTNNKMYVLYNNETCYGRLWDGSSWGSEETVFSGVDYDRWSVVAQNDDVHVVTATTSVVQYKKRTYGTGWGSTVQISSGGTFPAPVLTVDTNTGNLYVVWWQDNNLYYRKYNASTQTWENSVLLYNETEQRSASTALTSTYHVQNNAVGIVWSSKTSSPYDVKFEALSVEVAKTMTCQEALSMLDRKNISTMALVRDLGSLLDLSRATFPRQFIETVYATDILRRMIGPSLRETSTLSDLLSGRVATVLREGLTPIDTLQRRVSVVAREGVSLLDSILRRLDAIVREGITLSDWTLRRLSTVTRDTASLSDRLLKRLSMVTRDGTVLSDWILRRLTSVLWDTLLPLDSIALEKITRVTEVGFLDTVSSLDRLGIRTIGYLRDQTVLWDRVSGYSRLLLRDTLGSLDSAIWGRRVLLTDTTQVQDMSAWRATLLLRELSGVMDRIRLFGTSTLRDSFLAMDTKRIMVSGRLGEGLTLVDRLLPSPRLVLRESLVTTDYTLRSLRTMLWEGLVIKDYLLIGLRTGLLEGLMFQDRVLGSLRVILRDSVAFFDSRREGIGFQPREIAGLSDFLRVRWSISLLETITGIDSARFRLYTVIKELLGLLDSWVEKKEFGVGELIGLVDKLWEGQILLPVPVEVPFCRLYNRSSDTEVSHDIVRIRVDKSKGLVTEWTVELANPDVYTYFFNVGDVIEIYLGYGDSLTNVCSGLCYAKDVKEDSIELKGFDFGDYLVGHVVSMEFYDEDWAIIVKRLINAYSPLLDTSKITASGFKTGGRMVFENIGLLDAILLAMDGLRLASGREWVLEVTPSLEVRLIPKPLTSSLTVEDRVVASVSYRKDQSTMANRIIITGDKERIIDSFDTVSLRSEHWQVLSGGSYWVSSGPPDYDLYYYGNQAGTSGCLFTTINSFGGTVEVPVKQSVVSSASPFDFSIYIRTSVTNLDSGYRVRFYGPDSNNKHWVQLYRLGTLVASRDLSTLSTPVSYSANTYYSLRVMFQGSKIEVGIGDQRAIEYYDSNPIPSGKVGMLAPSGKVTTIDYFRLETDTPIWGVAEDLELQSRYGIKTVVLNMPELRLVSEASKIAGIELAKRRLENMQVRLTTAGNVKISIGDVISLEITEPEVKGDYLVLGLCHEWEEGTWTTTYTLAEVVPRLAELLAGLKVELSKRISITGMPRSINVADVITAISDAISLYAYTRNTIGESEVGVGYEYS